MMLLLAQLETQPPVEGINGWVIGFAISSLVAVVSAVWSEHQRRAERKDKKEGERTVAEISSQQKHLELSYQAVREALERQDKLIENLNQQLTGMKDEYMKVLEELRQERADSKVLQSENSELKIKVGTLEARIVQLEREVKSLEVSRDDARAACKKSEETSPQS